MIPTNYSTETTLQIAVKYLAVGERKTRVHLLAHLLACYFPDTTEEMFGVNLLKNVWPF